MAETRTQLTDDGADDPQRLEQEISKTRSEMAGTINAIQQRLEPERLKEEAERRVEQAVERAKDKVEDATIGRLNDMTERATTKAAGWRANMMSTIKDNPVPAALVGIGLGWLLMESSKDNGYDDADRYPRSYGYAQYGGYGYSDRGYSDAGARSDEMRYGMGGQPRQESGVAQKLQHARREVGEKVDELGNRVEETVDDLRERAGHVRDEAMERVEETTDDLRHRAERMRDDVGEQWHELRDEAATRARQMQHTARSQGRQATRSAQNLLRENPLAAGAAAVALGVLVGWALPSTETESRMVGHYRDELVDQARYEAQNIAERAQSVAGEAFGEVKEEAKAAARKTVDEVREEGKRAAQRVTENNA